MTYFGEFRKFWRALSAAALGVGFGYTINNYLNNLFIPSLMREFGWESSSISLLGLAALTSVVGQPLAGRMADRFGVRPVAIFGSVLGTAIYLLLSRMGGSFGEYLLLTTLQVALFGATTGPVVYSRLIAERFDRARGVALSIAISSPALAGALVAPFMSDFIDSEGWRTGYLLCAGLNVVLAATAILLVPPRSTAVRHTEGTGNGMGADLGQVFRNPAFAPIAIAILLCCMTITMQTTQLKVIVQRAGVSSDQAAYIVSAYALGVIGGRLLCGAALDRFPAHAVAAISLGLPGVGLAMLAAGFSDPVLLAIAVTFLGASLGAEGDLVGFLTMRYFDVRVYSMVAGILIGVLAISTAGGSLVLSLCLALTGSFQGFFVFAGVSSFIGGWLMWRLKHVPPVSAGH